MANIEGDKNIDLIDEKRRDDLIEIGEETIHEKVELEEHKKNEAPLSENDKKVYQGK